MNCPRCGVPHMPDSPHDASTMQYQACFQREHGRLPTWEDAMSHCSEEDKDLMRQVLKAKKVDPREVADMHWEMKRPA